VGIQGRPSVSMASALKKPMPCLASGDAATGTAPAARPHQRWHAYADELPQP
jgi:hypothetical protein